MTKKFALRAGRGAGSVGHQKPHKSPRDASSALASAFNRALEFHREGRLWQAEAMYRHILGAQPNHFDALHLLGVICYQRGAHAEAIRYIDAALKINPNFASAYNNRGNVLGELMLFDKAL